MSVLLDVFALDRVVSSLLDRALEGAGLTATEYAWYSMLGIAGPLTPTGLARLSGSAPTTVSEALRRLEDRGHLERRANPDDARSTLVSLSPAGRARLDDALPAFREVLDGIHDALGDEFATVRYAMARLRAAVAEVAGGDPPPSPPAPDAPPRLVYSGPALDPTDEQLVREHIAFLQWRREQTDR